ncbi:MAG: gamma-glutamyltranspeptidase/glutathione hydrolase [Myxococcota bacterium]|jgi:gamma-glutamyltranspeptidase/glutathione hydrolase
MSILRGGGNAVDAAVSAMLAAIIAEPMLTGLAGAGVATLRVGGATHIFDMFTDMPGLGRDPGLPVPIQEPIDINFGPTSQRFLIGAGSVAVPALGIGLARLHERHGRLPLSDVVEPAAVLATEGAPIRPGMARILSLVWPICRRSPELAKYMGRPGEDAPLTVGDTYRNPDLAETLRAFGRDGASLLTHGHIADAMLGALGDASLLTRRDLESYAPKQREPLMYRYRDATVWLPGPPSIAGLLVLQALRELEDQGEMPRGLGVEQVRRVAAAMARTEAAKNGRLGEDLFLPGFVQGFMSAIAADESRKAWRDAQMPGGSTGGHTTHISVVDEDGDIVGITASLGETCGITAGDTGVTLNNLLGEEDVNPQNIQRPPGHRLLTMCCPAIIERDDGTTIAVGSGGSSRIRSAILHAIVYAVDYKMSPAEIVAAPRLHFEAGHLNVELGGRPEGCREEMTRLPGDLKTFPKQDMFFGGLNIAGFDGQGQFIGAGDSRRSGEFQSTESGH